MTKTLQQRMVSYEESYDQRMTGKLPVVIKLNGWGFSSLSKNVSKPFCNKTMSLFSGTMVSLAKQIQNVVFGYQYSDKIILVLKNDNIDQDPWFNNSILSISSITSGLAAKEIQRNYLNMDDPPDLFDSPIFRSWVFPLPDTTEVINYLIYHQFRCYQEALNNAILNVSPPSALIDKDIPARKFLLLDKGIDFDKEYPSQYKNGTAIFLTPTLVQTPSGQITKHKWLLDLEIPNFLDNREFLKTILTTGSDIFRPERDM